MYSIYDFNIIHISFSTWYQELSFCVSHIRTKTLAVITFFAASIAASSWNLIVPFITIFCCQYFLSHRSCLSLANSSPLPIGRLRIRFTPLAPQPQNRPKLQAASPNTVGCAHTCHHTLCHPPTRIAHAPPSRELFDTVFSMIVDRPLYLFLVSTF